MERHRRDVDAIAKQVKGLFERSEPFRINHGSTNSTRQSALERRRTVDISHLRYVLDINAEAKTVLVEPNVPMDRLAETTLKYDLIPPVVMEFPGITVGGGYAGTSGESSSFKYGFFDRTINYVEIILADGEIVTASDSERSDLFHGAAGACGTFGITTLVELRLIDARKYVQTIYHPVDSMLEAVNMIRGFACHNTDFHYIDGIMYSSKQGVVITGRLTDDNTEGKVHTFSKAGDPWFYLHAKEMISRNASSSPSIDFIPLEEYLFRYDRGGFWVGRSAFEYFAAPFNKFTRWYLDKFFHTRMLYTALHASAHAKPYIVQDLALPFSKATQFVQFTDQVFNIYPLWLCPLRQSQAPTFHPHSKKILTDDGTDGFMLNIGLWGWGPRKHDQCVEANRQLENKLRELDGMKWLYANTYYSKDDFWNIYNQEWYDALRKKYKAMSLPSVYDKVSIDVEAERRAVNTSWKLWFLSCWPLTGIWGIWKAIMSKQYRLAEKARWQSIEERDRTDIKKTT